MFIRILLGEIRLQAILVVNTMARIGVLSLRCVRGFLVVPFPPMMNKRCQVRFVIEEDLLTWAKENKMPPEAFAYLEEIYKRVHEQTRERPAALA
jgi:hypothetical protein